MNPTLLKFNYPQSLVSELTHWAILLRPAQVTLGALVLASRHDATSFSGLPAEAFTELKQATTRIEAALMRFRPYDKLNLMALMMVDPQVHFHVVPRYAANQEFHGMTFRDTGWPAVPDLKYVNQMAPDVHVELQRAMVDAFAKLV